VAGSLLALLADWALHGLPDIDGFAIIRANLLVQDLFLPVSASGQGVSPDPITLGIFVCTPMLMALLASWLMGRFVAGWHARVVFGT
jgi:hypothetical protein